MTSHISFLLVIFYPIFICAACMVRLQGHSPCLEKTLSFSVLVSVNSISLKLGEEKLWPQYIPDNHWLIFYFSVKIRLVFQNCFFWELYSEPQHLFNFPVYTFECEGYKFIYTFDNVTAFCTSFLGLLSHALTASFRELVFHQLTFS